MFKIKNYFYIFSLILIYNCNSLDKIQNIPIEKRTFFLNNFSNETSKSEIAINLTENLRTELGHSKNFSLVNERNQANFWLTGSIISFQKRARGFSNFDEASEFELNVISKINLRLNTILNKVDDSSIMSKEFEARVYYSNMQGYLENELQAEVRLLRNLSKQIIQSVHYSLIKYSTDLKIDSDTPN